MYQNKLFTLKYIFKQSPPENETPMKDVKNDLPLLKDSRLKKPKCAFPYVGL